VEIPPGRKMVSYDVSALCTSIPVQDAIEIIKQRQEQDNTLKERTPLSVERVISLLTFCLQTTYFKYNDQFYQQCSGAAMGSPVSPIVANLYMEDFETRALSTAPSPPSTWLRYVDDTFVIAHEYDIDGFTDHINSINPSIQFTTEPEVDGKLAFLDTVVVLQDEGNLKTLVYRKPTHTDQYLSFHSNHHLTHKRSVVRSLLNRAETLVTDEDDKEKERQHVKNVLVDNGYKLWMFKAPKTPKPKDTTNTRTIASRSYPIPYVQGLAEQLAKIYKKHGVSTHFKPHNTLRNHLVNPKDKTPDMKTCGIIYHLKFADCPQCYVGETARSFEMRLKEHKKTKGPLTAVGEHLKTLGHHLAEDKTKVLARQDKYWPRKIHESIEIRIEKPQMNRDAGYYLPPVYNHLLSGDLNPRSPDRKA
jgi:hypothetical protein